MVWGQFVGFCVLQFARDGETGLVTSALILCPIGSRKAQNLPGSAEIRGFGSAVARIGAYCWRVSDAAKQNLRKSCRENFDKCGFFKNLFGTRDLAVYFCIEWVFTKIFRCSRPRGVAQICPKSVFFGALSFCFDLAHCLSSWWKVERLYQNNKKKENKKQSMTAIIGFVIFVSFSYCVVLVQRFCFIFYMLMASYYSFLNHHSSSQIQFPYSIFLVYCHC